MVLKLLEKHGELTVEQLSQIMDKPVHEIEKEIEKLWSQRKVCIDNKGLCYIPPRTSFPTMLVVVFIVFICSWFLIGAMKATF